VLFVVKGKGMVLDIAPLNDAQQRFTTLEVAADWHWLVSSQWL